ncbi:MAG: nitroreductase [Paracoccaceae bacterium]
MPERNDEALRFLLTRRSRPAKTLVAPVPSDDEILTMLTAAGRCPDHGKLEPWRFLVLRKPALERLAALTAELGAVRPEPPEKAEKTRRQFADADLVVAVVHSPVETEKVPTREQLLSGGAACLSLLNAALASGWGANWLTGWMASDRRFLSRGLGIEPPEFVVGFVHIGTETIVPPERPRPDVSALTTWIGE